MNYYALAVEYADRVCSGEQPACEFVRLACQRFLDDLERENFAYGVQIEIAERWCRFLELLPHVKGKWAARGERFQLSDFQIFITVNLYGWIHRETGFRRFTEAYIEVPRKNGKSFFVAGLGLGHLILDDECGAEIYTGATSEKQAWEVFRPARLICLREPDLLQEKGIDVNAKTITRPVNGSRFEPIIGNPGDGASPSCAIADEYHEHRTSDQVDTLQTGMGSREQPMMIYITTAGSDMGGPCYAKRSDVINILKGSVEDDRVFGIIYTLDEGDDWDTVEAQKKANPNYGISVSAEFLEGQLKQARRSPTKQSAYKTKHLNLWVGAKAAWMNILAFQRCRKQALRLDSFNGEPCYLGLDLASKIDIASLAILFPPGRYPRWAAFFRHYLPEETVLEGGNTRYKAWHQSGHLIATPGNVTDYGYIEDDLDGFKSQFQIEAVAFDPFQATQFSTRMVERGFPMIEVGATVKNFSEPMKEVEALTLKQQLEYDMDPVLLWMMGNVVAKLDKKDNIFPDKERPEKKIDGVVALIMAMNRALLSAPEEGGYTGTYGVAVL